MENLYWGIYLNLEREVLRLAEMLHFDDNQLKVYSSKIADLLIRCNIEAESIIRELYKRNFSSSADSIGAMLISLDKEWALEKKQVSIISTTMHFSPVYAHFCPYKYDAKDEDDFYSAYNAIKHDRGTNFEKYATLHYLIRALGALFLLNIYFRNEPVTTVNLQSVSDNRMGSSIFELKTFILQVKYPVKEKILTEDEELSATYIIKPTERSYKQYYDENERIFDMQIQELERGGYESLEDENGEKQCVIYENRFIEAAKISPDMVLRLSRLEEPVTKKIRELSYERILCKKSTICVYPTSKED